MGRFPLVIVVGTMALLWTPRVQSNSREHTFVEPGTENLEDPDERSLKFLLKGPTSSRNAHDDARTCASGLKRSKREVEEYVPCEESDCALPECFCTARGVWPPFRGVKTEHDFTILPQVVVLAIEGSVNHNNIAIIRDIFDSALNPDLCMISGTVFAPIKDSDFVLVHDLDSRGIEMAMLPGHFYSAEEGFGVLDADFEAPKVLRNWADLKTPILGSKLPVDIPITVEHYGTMVENDFVYDATLRVPKRYSEDLKDFEPPVWPYSLQTQIPHECEEHPSYRCPSRSYALWEVPTNEYISPAGGNCLSFEDCPGAPTHNSSLFIQLLDSQLERSLRSNKAPLVIHLNIEMLEKSRSHRVRLVQWIKDTMVQHEGVYFLSIDKMLEWIEKGSQKTEWQAIPTREICSENSVKNTCVSGYVKLAEDAKEFFGNREAIPVCANKLKPVAEKKL